MSADDIKVKYLEIDISALSPEQVEQLKVDFQREASARMRAFLDDAVSYGYDTAIAWARSLKN